ncbi:hypothetical protein RhiLY_03479 [Ceratobasidium sp. AG-Ba]|nr:hypothetical protein RhiLY_03479 [Ceratobasidium sp. AG-Ba]
MKKRFHPFRDAIVTVESDESDKVTVIGRRRAATTAGGLRRSLLAPSVERVSYPKLSSMQKRDSAIDEKIMKERTTAAQQAEFVAFQESFSGGMPDAQSLPSPSFEFLHDAHSEDDGDSDTEDYNEEEFMADEIAASEDLGLKQPNEEWEKRRQSEHSSWLQQLPALCDAYLQFRLQSALQDSEPVISDSEFEIRCIDMDSENMKKFCLKNGGEGLINEVLVRHGYIGCSPLHPKLAISLKFLELFANVMRRGPSVSVQTLAKASCDSRNVPYTRHFRTQLTSALDVFGMVEREIRRRRDIALGRNNKDDEIKNKCPACSYKLENEPPLKYSMQVTCDGNDSLKRCAKAGASDRQRFHLNWYITPDEVDAFQHEVPGRRKGKKNRTKADDSSESVCEKRWKNAKIHERGDGDKPKTVFCETGIFLSSCRHSFILTCCDMIESGEQAKYGLATIHKLVSIFGPDIVMGYDIGCSFKKTAARSAQLGAWLEEQRFKMCVGAFHGPAHNQLCQFDNHPRNIPGTGLTDFENCETVFSSTNRLAGTTRLASVYHRLQKIDNHIYGFDDDQYLQLGYLLRSKYIDALGVLEQAESIMGELCSGVSAEDLERYWQEERQYLESLKSELPEDTFAIEYINILEKLAAKQAEYDTCMAADFHFENGPSSSNLHRTTLQTARLESRRRNTREQLMTLQNAVLQMEEDHDIMIRWTCESEEWLAAEGLRRRRAFQLCVDELEHLVVLRLLELSRAGLAGTCYKLRQHIMKALIARSAAVKAALAQYNQAALDLYGSSARQFTWEEVSKLSALAEFELLRGSRRQPLQQEWGAQRFDSVLSSGTALNVQRRRSFVSMLRTVSKVKSANARLGWAVEHYMSRRLKINAMILRDINLLCKLPGYTGESDTGLRLGSGTCGVPVPPTSSAVTCTADPLTPPVTVASVDRTGAPEYNNDQEPTEHLLNEDEDRLSELVAQWQLVI